MVLLDHLWDDTVTGPQPDRSLKKVYTKPLNIKDIGVEGSSKYQKSLSMSARSLSPTAVRKDSVWRSAFHLGTKTVGANPTVYDWLYSGDHEKV
ncbi:auxin-repressed 12.5 kDa protein-like [Salvia divinorum]|uniref:Auxin-repressed 12.5 kDa protein-like n=1 Tax=Salvia divinorum TaxID=28513 RepID=A0ABD1I2Y5_SALDI